MIGSAAASTLLLTLAPILLFAAFESAISGYYRGETNVLTQVLKPPSSVARLSRDVQVAERKINLALMESPGQLADPAFIESLVAGSESLAAALRVGSGPVRVFGSVDMRRLDALPPFGALADPSQPPPDPDRGRHNILSHTDFLTASGERASLFLIMASRHPRPPAPPFSRQVSILVIAGLVALNGSLGVFFLLRVTRPLRVLERAADAVGSGEFGLPVASPGVRELEPVFTAFDSMRASLAAIRERERTMERGRRELIANLSHDLRTPVAAIKGYADGLADGVADTPEKRARYIDVLRDRAGQLERMIDEIFLLSTLESREASRSAITLDLRAFLSAGTEEMRLSRDTDVLAIDMEGRDGPPVTVIADPLTLRRAIENVVQNAIHHSGRRPVTVYISLSIDDGFAKIDIGDDGRGFSDEELRLATDRFYRGDPARGGGFGGLGLAIAREIAESSGGSIALGQAAGGGALVSFRLPLAPAAQALSPEGGSS
ncbi:MAG: HAMP domain-containing sensor histidine kinase [Spirochaetes bacterium]|nr:HAMP domain-containing sensor histidine kinase [Spirochaetota bacterium]